MLPRAKVVQSSPLGGIDGFHSPDTVCRSNQRGVSQQASLIDIDENNAQFYYRILTTASYLL